MISPSSDIADAKDDTVFTFDNEINNFCDFPLIDTLMHPLYLLQLLPSSSHSSLRKYEGTYGKCERRSIRKQKRKLLPSTSIESVNDSEDAGRIRYRTGPRMRYLDVLRATVIRGDVKQTYCSAR